MKRAIYTHLLKWKNSINRKPLLLYGARQKNIYPEGVRT